MSVYFRIEALFRACRAYGLGEQFNAAAQDEARSREPLPSGSIDELPIEVAAATARLLKHHARSGAWIENSPRQPQPGPAAARWPRPRPRPSLEPELPIRRAGAVRL